MAKFIVLYHAPAAAMEQMASATPEQKAEGMKPWMVWKDSMGSKILDMGSPCCGAQRLETNQAAKPSTNEVCGYSLIEAADMEEAKSLLAEHPHLTWADGAAIEVCECMDMSGEACNAS